MQANSILSSVRKVIEVMDANDFPEEGREVHLTWEHYQKLKEELSLVTGDETHDLVHSNLYGCRIVPAPPQQG
jgi:hypothetical protein